MEPLASSPCGGRLLDRADPRRRGPSWVADGDPMEAALDALAQAAWASGHRDAGLPGARRFPFDPHRRRMSVVGRRRALRQGRARQRPAPLLDAGREPPRRRCRWPAAGCGCSPSRSAGAPRRRRRRQAPSGTCTLLGLSASRTRRDRASPRPSPLPAAGIRVAMITGDSGATAHGDRPRGRPLADRQRRRRRHGPAGRRRGTRRAPRPRRRGRLPGRPEDKLRIAQALRAAATSWP